MGKIEPPETEGLKTKLPGTGLTHKLALIFNEPATIYSKPSEDVIKSSPKAVVEPTLETWLSTQIGPLNKIGCCVKLFQKVEVEDLGTEEIQEVMDILAEVDVNLSDLQVSYQHLMYLSLNPCLLYTSPSPRDATLSRMPSSA